MKELSFEQLESIDGGMSCAWASAGLIVAGASFVFFTGGWGSLLLNSAGVGFGAYGYLESCYGQLMS